MLTENEKEQIVQMRKQGIRRSYIADRLCLDARLVGEFCDTLLEFDQSHRVADPTPAEIAARAAEIKALNIDKHRKEGSRSFYDRMPRHYASVPAELR